MKSALVVGAGFSGSVVARELANSGYYYVDVLDSRDHVGGNCHTSRDGQTSIMVHTYGPHIFNTSIPEVWTYVNKYGEWVPFINRVKAKSKSGVYSLPINLHTINQFLGTHLNPAQAKEYLQHMGKREAITSPSNFEEQAISMLGRGLYEEFFKGYTQKQWGCSPTELPASILKRLPVRLNYDDNYYNSTWQAIPKEGYTAVVENILSHGSISVHLGCKWSKHMNSNYDLVIYTGPIDSYFDYAHGRLGYRTVYWEKEYGVGDLQGNAVINYTSLTKPYTRVHEHKHFAPWENHHESVLFTEFSKETGPEDIPYYPKRLASDLESLAKYQPLIDSERANGVEFIGRLGTYRYLNMDQTISEALQLSRRILSDCV